MIFFTGPEITSPWVVGWPLERSKGGSSGYRWKMECARTWVDVVVIVCGNFLLIPMVFSVKSLAENKNEGLRRFW